METAELLILHGADVNALTREDQSPLLLSIDTDSRELIELLLQRGANPNVVSRNMTTPLIEAIKRNNEKTVNLLLKYGADVNQLVGEASPLSTAFYSRNMSLSETLLKAGADPNLIYANGKLLQWAKVLRYSELALLLKEYGAYDPDEQSQLEADSTEWENSDTKILFEAIKEAEDETTIAELLNSDVSLDSRNLEGDTPLLSAILLGRSSVIRMLLDRGADPNLKNPLSGETPLMRALGKKDFQTAELLLESGADLDDVNNRGETALIIMAAKNDLNAVEYLVDKGCNLDIEDSFTQTAATKAYRHKDRKIFNYLIERAASVDCQILVNACRKGNDKKLISRLLKAGCGASEAALLAAVEAGKDHIVKILLQHGASADAVDINSSNTALTLASRRGHSKIVELLLHSGAWADDRGRNYTTALIEAAKAGDLKIVRLLMSNGADTNLEDDKGRTALYYAEQTQEYLRYTDLNNRLKQSVNTSQAERNKLITQIKDPDMQNITKIIELLRESMG